MSDLENESLHVCPFDYLPATDAQKLFKPWAGSREVGMVAVYDPAIEVVICFVRKGDGDETKIDAYKIKTRPTPPEAAEPVMLFWVFKIPFFRLTEGWL